VKNVYEHLGQKQRSYLDIISYLIIERSNSIHGEDPSGVYFNKAFSLFNHYHGKRFGISVPHCWYRWGDEVVRSCLSRDVVWDHQERTRVRWDGDQLEVQDEELVSIIGSIIKKHPLDKEGTKNMIKEVYSYAPYDFQRTFLELRDAIDSLSTLDRGLEDLSVGILRKLKDRAFSQYHTERLCDHDSFSIWSELFDRFLETSDYKLLKDTNETFWFEFCYHLRIKENENVPRPVLEYWKENLEYDSRNMYNQLIDYARILKDKNVKLSEDLLVRIRDREEERRMIDELIEELYDGKEMVDIEKNYTYRSKLM
jgi:hypothetical protein